MLALPMHVAGDFEHVEAPPLERATFQVKMQVGIFLVMHRDGAMDMGERGLREVVRFDCAGDMGANSARNDHGIGGADAIGDVDLLGAKVRAEAVRADLLLAALEPGVENLEQAVGVMKRGLEASGGFAAEGEIGQRHASFESSPLKVMPAAPNLSVNHRRVGVGEIVEALLLLGPQQRAQGSQIERAANMEVEVFGAVAGVEYGFKAS